MTKKPTNLVHCSRCGCPIDLGPDNTASCAVCGSFAWSGTGPTLIRLKGPGRIAFVIGGVVLLTLVLFLWAASAVAGMGSSGRRAQSVEMTVPIVRAVKPSTTMAPDLTSTPRLTARATAKATVDMPQPTSSPTSVEHPPARVLPAASPSME